MKKLLIKIVLTVLISGCNGDGKTITRLTDQQRDFLGRISTNANLTFSINGEIHSVVVGVITINQIFERGRGGGMTAKELTYYHEEGQRVCKNTTDTFQITLYARSEQAYGDDGNFAKQSVTIINTDKSSVIYLIDFSKTLPSKTIAEKRYSNVLYSVVKQDTLFWKEDTSILGWTNTAKGYTTYRVF